MNEILCFDENGDSIDKLSQWDTNLELFINWEYSVTPIFHFYNTNSRKILVVKGLINSEKNTAQASIPNILLQESYPIIVFVYLEQETATGYLKGESIYNFQIPVYEKPKPQDYKYVENTEYISWIKLEQNLTSRIEKIVARGNEVVGEYESALDHVLAVKDEVDNVKDEADTILDNINTSVSENKKVLKDITKVSEDVEEYGEELRSSILTQVSNATEQANDAKSEASSAKRYAREASSSVQSAQRYAEQAQKYAEQAHKTSDILYLEERVSKLESVSTVETNIASVENLKDYLGI